MICPAENTFVGGGLPGPASETSMTARSPPDVSEHSAELVKQELRVGLENLT